jgi:predicted alpha/beta hydrolase family esterase
MPSWETNCIEDWETKIDAIVEETFDENMTIISGTCGCKCILSVCNKRW